MGVSGSFILITSPNADLVAFVALADDGAAYFVAVLAELLANHRQQQLKPTNVELFIHRDKPPTAALVGFPSRLGSLAKNVVVAGLGKAGRGADVVEQSPECFDTVEGAYTAETRLPGFVATIVIKVPEYPSMLERMIDLQYGG